MCYIYEDGSFCRVVIDGEPVNPSWGITKAGKPRKRLAQACLTCREKKIKCEPAIPKCHQCAKSQRVCRGYVNGVGGSIFIALLTLWTEAVARALAKTSILRLGI
jgi:hypothetical protein